METSYPTTYPVTTTHILPRSAPSQAIHTVVHSDTHVYIDSFTTLYEANTFIYENAPGQNAWKVISKVVR